MIKHKKHRGLRLSDVDNYIDHLENTIEELEEELRKARKESSEYLRNWISAQEQSHTRFIKSMLGINLAEDQIRMDKEKEDCKNGQKETG